MTTTLTRTRAPIRARIGIGLYEGTLRHRRFGPTARSFDRQVSYAYLDLASIPADLDRLPLWSARRPAPVRFRRRDYFDGSDRPLDDAVRSLVADRTGVRPNGPIGLLTQLRRSGWLFNPMSVYFCHDAEGRQVETIVLEVTNTPWKERCWYVIVVDPDRPAGPWDFPKQLHVSPFLAMDLTYRLRAAGPDDRLTLRLEDRRGDDLVFAADLALRWVALDRRRAVLSALRRPLSTWQVSAAIYTHAARLWARRVPLHRHPGAGPP
jgi:DUF1365 family protein